MKKLLTLATAAVLILGLAAATYAVEFKASGFINNYTLWGQNLCNFPVEGIVSPDAIGATTNTGFDDYWAYSNIWAHLDFTFTASEDLSGYFGFEAGPSVWGLAGAGTWYPGTTVNLYKVYVDAKVPGTDAFPTRALVGVQSWVFSPKFAIFEYGPGVRLNSTVGPAAVSLFWRKHEEGVYWQADDMDSYGASVRVPAGPVTAEVWSIYYAIRENAAAYPIPDSGDPAINAGFSDGYHWYTGVNVTGAVGPVGLVGDFVYETRQVDYDYAIPGTGFYGQPVLYDGEDSSGWVGRITAAIPVGMFTVGGEFMYGSGGDRVDEDNKREWRGYQVPIPTTPRFGLNVTLLGDAALVYYRSYSHVWPGLTSNPGDDWYAKGFARVSPVKWMTVTMNGLYIGDNVKNGDRFGTAVNLLGFPEDNDYAGIEFDLITRFQIYDNLSAEVGGGYLIAGDALDQNIPGTNLNESPKDPWVIITNLSYVF